MNIYCQFNTLSITKCKALRRKNITFDVCPTDMILTLSFPKCKCYEHRFGNENCSLNKIKSRLKIHEWKQ